MFHVRVIEMGSDRQRGGVECWRGFFSFFLQYWNSSAVESRFGMTSGIWGCNKYTRECRNVSKICLQTSIWGQNQWFQYISIKTKNVWCCVIQNVIEVSIYLSMIIICFYAFHIIIIDYLCVSFTVGRTTDIRGCHHKNWSCFRFYFQKIINSCCLMSAL